MSIHILKKLLCYLASFKSYKGYKKNVHHLDLGVSKFLDRVSMFLVRVSQFLVRVSYF